MKPIDTTPLIFLDIHGVLTSDASKIAYGDDCTFDEVAVALVKHLAKSQDACIVITSSVRLDMDGEALMCWLRKKAGKGFVKRVAGCTGKLVTRGAEVHDFRIQMMHTGPYIIIDNLDATSAQWSGEQVHNHLIVVDKCEGFGYYDFKRADNMLSKLCADTSKKAPHNEQVAA